MLNETKYNKQIGLWKTKISLLIINNIVDIIASSFLTQGG